MNRVMALVLLIIATPAWALAAPTACSSLRQNVNRLAATITRSSDDYWAQRRTIVEGEQSPAAVAPSNGAQAERVRLKASTAKSSMNGAFNDFVLQLSEAQKQNCLNPAEARSLREPAVIAAKRVRFDALPGKPSESAPTRQTSTMMPRR